MDWTQATINNDTWSFTDMIPEDWYDSEETAVVIEAQAVGDGDLISNAANWVRIGRMIASFGSPSSGSVLSDTVTFSGTAQGIEPSELHYRVDSEEWELAIHSMKKIMKPKIGLSHGIQQRLTMVHTRYQSSWSTRVE